MSGVQAGSSSSFWICRKQVRGPESLRKDDELVVLQATVRLRQRDADNKGEVKGKGSNVTKTTREQRELDATFAERIALLWTKRRHRANWLIRCHFACGWTPFRLLVYSFLDVLYVASRRLPFSSDCLLTVSSLTSNRPNVRQYLTAYSLSFAVLLGICTL